MQLHLSYNFFSLTTDVNRVSHNPRVPTAQQGVKDSPGVRVHYFYFWLFVNYFSSPVNGYSEGRRPLANVGVHSYISKTVRVPV